MKKIMLTDPFSGTDFEAYEFDDKSMIAIHPLTKETVRVFYDAQKHSFMVPVSAFEHIETMTMQQAADYMNVSVQRVSNACKSGKLPLKELPNGAKMIVKKDLINYNETKKCGRPRKDANNA